MAGIIAAFCGLELRSCCTHTIDQTLGLGPLLVLPEGGPSSYEAGGTKLLFIGVSNPMCTVHEAVKRHQEKATGRQKVHYDLRATAQVYKEGELVWVKNQTRKKGISPKLQRRYKGPYKIVKKLSDVLYELVFLENGVKSVLHHNRLKLYLGPKPIETGTVDSDLSGNQNSQSPGQLDPPPRPQRKRWTRADQRKYWWICPRKEPVECTVPLAVAQPDRIDLAVENQEPIQAQEGQNPEPEPVTEVPEPVALQRSQRVRKAPAWHQDYEMS
nr:PREDICTED: uncharacterized protein LOC106703317 [Latimeria chalumnae]|eukprot:XP_014343395.1 PREDICTED: uncharacterized protein LOC106703317 [Latimeria chalumnae]